MYKIAPPKHQKTTIGWYETHPPEIYMEKVP